MPVVLTAESVAADHVVLCWVQGCESRGPRVSGSSSQKSDPLISLVMVPSVTTAMAWDDSLDRKRGLKFHKSWGNISLS